MAKKKEITIHCFMLVDIDNYQNTFLIFAFLKFKGRVLLLLFRQLYLRSLLSESRRNQTINCGFKLLFIVRT